MTLSSGRVEFTEATRKMVMEEAGYCCANPGCRMHLLEFYTEQNKTRKLGDVAHIYSAVSLSGSGPRSNPHMTPEQLSAQTNGIYLCTTCHRRVDNCELMFPAEHHFSGKERRNRVITPRGETAGRIQDMDERRLTTVGKQKNTSTSPVLLLTLSINFV